jgi:hypothetical protein
MLVARDQALHHHYDSKPVVPRYTMHKVQRNLQNCCCHHEEVRQEDFETMKARLPVVSTHDVPPGHRKAQAAETADMAVRLYRLLTTPGRLQEQAVMTMV